MKAEECKRGKLVIAKSKSVYPTTYNEFLQAFPLGVATIVVGARVVYFTYTSLAFASKQPFPSHQTTLMTLGIPIDRPLGYRRGFDFLPEDLIEIK